MNINLEFAQALQRIKKNIERRYQLALNIPIKTVNRSVGALFGKRWGYRRT